MSKYLLSSKMIVTFDGSTMGCTTDFSQPISRDMIEISCMNSTGAKEVIPDMYSWSSSFSGLRIKTANVAVGDADYASLVDNIISNTDVSVGISFLPDVSLNYYYKGGGYLSSVTQDGGVGSVVSYSAEVTGSGPLTKTTTT